MQEILLHQARLIAFKQARSATESEINMSAQKQRRNPNMAFLLFYAYSITLNRPLK